VLAHIGDRQSVGASIRNLLLHLDNRAERVERLLSEMLGKRDQWLPLTGSGAPAPEIRAALESQLVQLVERVLQEISVELPAQWGDELAELLALAGQALEVDQPDAELCAWKELSGLPAAEHAALELWRALAATFVRRDGSHWVWRKRLDRRQGFYPGDPELKNRALALLEQMRERPVLLALLGEAMVLPTPAYDDQQWAILQDLLEILPLAAAELKLVFRDAGATDYAEVAAEALRALGQPGSPTELALAIDYRFRHILIDEFQDTSRQQFELLNRLTEGWEQGDGRTLFLVGDPMQSIYRFRQAEVGLYMKVKTDGLGAIKPKFIRLSANFRSDPLIVQWVNRTFAGVFPAQDDLISGAVAFMPSEAALGEHRDGTVELIPDNSGNRLSEAAQVVDLVQQTLRRWPGESIGILVRSRGHARELVPALTKAGVPFAGAELEFLADAPVVQDLVALTRALTNFADRIAWLALLRAPWCGLTLADLHQLAYRDHDSAVWELVCDDGLVSELSADGQQRVRGLRSAIATILLRRGTLALRDLVEGAWQSLGGPATFGSDADQQRANRFLKYLDTLDRGGDCPDAARLPDEIPRLKAKLSGVVPAVQVMTMHGAKGLEFNTVILPGLGRGTKTSAKAILSWKEIVTDQAGMGLLLAPIERTGAVADPISELIRRLDHEQDDREQDRLLYVAMTRARRRLHLIGQVSAVTTPESDCVWRTPAAGTLLRRLWASVAPEFAAATPLPAATAVAASAWLVPRIRRLPSTWKHPGAPDACLPADTDASPDDAAIVSYDWAGPTAMHIGSVVHRWLQQIAETGVERYSEKTIRKLAPLYRRMLSAAGVNKSELTAATATVTEALLKTLADETGRWLLSSTHAESASEFPLSVIDGSNVEQYVIDRTFVTGDGIRWIVDYKASVHEGTDLDGFVEAETQRYRQQLLQYRTAMAKFDRRQARTALYFPLLSVFRVVDLDRLPLDEQA
jgi:ATP-dependent exoDNAse (exonuclease V) beta subunit